MENMKTTGTCLSSFVFAPTKHHPGCGNDSGFSLSTLRRSLAGLVVLLGACVLAAARGEAAGISVVGGDWFETPATNKIEMFGPVLTVAVSGLEPGKYTVEIDAAENYFDAPGKRVMSVRSGEQILAAELDLFKEAGKHKAYTLKGEVTHPVNSANTPLQLTLTGLVDNAKFDAIRVKNATGQVIAETTAAELKKRAQKWHSDNGDGTYTNPVIFADFPDPDVIRVDDTYYMVTTTMFVFPGVTVLKSKDLVNWEYCSNAVPRFDFSPAYDLDRATVTGTDNGRPASSTTRENFTCSLSPWTRAGFSALPTRRKVPGKSRNSPKDSMTRVCSSMTTEEFMWLMGQGKSASPNWIRTSRQGDDVLVFTGDIRNGLEGTPCIKSTAIIICIAPMEVLTEFR